MNRKDRAKRNFSTWRALHGALWLVGLAVLAWTDSWWPGILVLVALSMVLEGIMRRGAPRALPEMPRPAAGPPLDLKQPKAPLAATPVSPPIPAPIPPADWLPGVCPRCGGPIRETEVKWIGTRSAECPFCGTLLTPKGR
jgi:hypothetical protein